VKISKTIFFILIIVSHFLFSCGTIIKTSEDVVAVDSSMRGFDVFDEKHTKLGTTPFFYEINKQKSQHFYLVAPNQKNDLKYSCSFDFSESIFPNLLTGYLALPLGIITSGVDWYKGNIYKCRDKIYFETSAANKPIEIMKNILIIPLQSQSFVTNHQIESEVLKQEKNDSEKLITLNHELSHLGITPYTNNQISNLNFNILNPLLLQNKISHLLVFEYNMNETNILVTPILIDAFTRQKIPTHFKSFTIESQKYSKIDKFLDKFHFVPNSLKITTSEITNDQKDVIVNSRHPKSFPKFFTSFSVGNVYSQYAYNPWDYDFYTSPNFALPSWKSSFANNQYFFQSLAGFYNGGILLKSPFGALSVEIGYGGMYFFEKPNQINHSLLACIDSTVAYVFYFSKKLFFTVQTQFFTPVNAYISNQPVKIQQTAVGFGYYFPELETIFREKF
jgi:hypothetical protein